MSIEVNQLTKIYGNQKAIDSISFSVNEGEILGFLGPNGAGKSTMMKIATGFIPPSEGEVRIAGFDVVNESHDVRKNIGYLPEHNPLYLDMYVHEYLGFIAALHGLKGKNKLDQIKRMVDLCGLTIEQNKKIGSLSKGYRQRVGLAQALIHDPKVLILDEPTTGLDPNQLAEIRALIKKISKDKTVILSTHIMQEVKALCSRVIIINLGKVVADDTVEHLSKISDGQILNVEFQKQVESEALNELEGIEILNGDGLNFKLKSDKDIREALFKFAADKGWIILSMQAEEADLETVFYQLTNGEA
jgi:ABC-2 type transport system ATP-binding protein